MKNIFRNILVSGMAVVMFASCDLNLAPTDSIVYEEGTPLLLQASDVTNFQNGVLASYRAVQYGVFTQSSEVMCDGFNATIGFGNNYGSVHRADYSFTPSDTYSESMWASHYSAIKNYNIAISECALVPEDADYKTNATLLEAIAKYCRASSYLTLARHFGVAYNPATASTDLCVPLVLVYNQWEKPARATVQAVYDQIYDDLVAAESILTAAAEAGITINKVNLAGAIRASVPTVDAVRALLARYYLDTQDYGSAIDAAESVLGSAAGYKLSSTAADMQAEYTTDLGTEPIVQLYASISEGAVSNPIFTSVNTGTDVAKYFSAYYLPTANLVNSYSSSDLRFSTWFANDLYPVFSSGNYYEGIYVFTKYLDNPNLHNKKYEQGLHAAKPLLISEMYLIAAEAYAMLGDASGATQILNALRTARKAGAVTGDIMDEIKLEWFRETVGEGLRFTCLKRWGDGIEAREPQPTATEVVMTGDAYTDRVVEAGSHIFNWPVPTYEMKINQNLVQNDGYGSAE